MMTALAPITPNPDTASFLDYLFGEQAGWLIAGHIAGDPSIKEGETGYSPLKEERFPWPRQRSEALSWFASHDAQEHNIYVKMCLFRSGRSTVKNALPSRIIWQDDVTDPNKVCSVLVETSPGRYQAIIRLDRDASTAERQRLAATWREESKDCEDYQNISKDVVHFIRIPGGHNSKRGGWHPVIYAQRSERTYSADRLLARCGETHLPCSSGGVSKARAEQHQADAWDVLHDGAALFHSKRWQAIIAGRPQLRQLLVERQRVIIYNKSGQADDSTSAQRAVFVQNLVTAWSEKNPGHLPEAEIRAVAMFLKPMLGRGKTIEQYQVDIDCLLALYRPKNYRPVATHCIPGKAAPIVVTALPASEPRPRGRHYRAEQTRAAQLDKVRTILLSLPTDAAGAIRLDTKAIGGELGKSPRQIRNYLADLADQREIKYIARGAGRSLAILLTDSFQTPKAAPAPTTDQPAEREIKSARDADEQSPVLPALTPQTAHDGGAPHGETENLGGSVFLQERAGAKNSLDDDHSLPALRDLAAYYLDQPAAAIGQRCVSERTGQITYRRTARHFAGLVVADYGDCYTADEALDAYAAEQQHRKELAAAEWRRFFARLKAMNDAELIAYIAGGCRREVHELAREGTPFDKHQYRTRLKCAQQHLGWRGLTMPGKGARTHGQMDRPNAAHHTGTSGRRAGSGAPVQQPSTAPQTDQRGGGGDRTSPGPVQACAGEATAPGAALMPGTYASLYAHACRIRAERETRQL